MTAIGAEPRRALVAGAESLAGRRDDQWPPVTVAILAFNRRDALRVTLAKTLTELDYPARALDVIVVDNASTDGTADMVAAEYPSVQLIRLDRNVGISGCNEAFAVATGDWCLVLDDDCWIDGEALKFAVASAESSAADLVSFRVRSGVEPDYLFSEAYTFGLFGFWGCALMVSRRALGVLHGYDPNIFMWGNEVEFTMRLLSAGFRHLYLPEVIAVHMKGPPSGPEDDFPRHSINIRHWSYAAAKLLGPLDAIRVIGRLLATTAIDTVAMSPRAAATFPAALAGVIAGLRARDPVRPEVSALYRANFVSFANPIGFIRTPRERWRARRDPSRAAGDAQRRQDAFRDRRRAFYPSTDAAVLDI